MSGLERVDYRDGDTGLTGRKIIVDVELALELAGKKTGGRK